MKYSSMTGVLAFLALLTAFWMINSGYFKPLLLGLGLLSVLGVLFLNVILNRKDQGSFPSILPSWNLPGYLLWVMGEIVKANFDVMTRIIKGPSSISPVIITVKAEQKSEVARVLYANSITMTPGTVTLSLRNDLLEVHALTKQAALSLKEGEMGRRVSSLESP